MENPERLYKRHRFPAEIIQYAVWLYYRLNLSHRDIEDLLAEKGILVSYEAIRLWCNKFGPQFARRLQHRHRGFGDTFFIDEVFVKIRGKQRYLWRAVDQDGEVIDVLLQSRRDGRAAKRFCKRLIRKHGGEPRKIVTDGWRSYLVAHRELISDSIHNTSQYANNRAELSHQPTHVRERGMQRFKSNVTGAAISESACCSLQPLPPGTSPSVSKELSNAQVAGLCILEKRSSMIRADRAGSIFV